MLIGCPFAFCFILALFWILYKFYSNQKIATTFENFLITTSITFFFFQSTIINGLADLLNCTKIENQYYLTNYLIEKCDKNLGYDKWRNFMIIPAFCFFSIFLTIVPFIYMYKNRGNLYSENILRKVGFLLNGYSTNYFYWYFEKKKFIIKKKIGNLFIFSKKYLLF